MNYLIVHCKWVDCMVGELYGNIKLLKNNSSRRLKEAIKCVIRDDVEKKSIEDIKLCHISLKSTCPFFFSPNSTLSHQVIMAMVMSNLLGQTVHTVFSMDFYADYSKILPISCIEVLANFNFKMSLEMTHLFSSLTHLGLNKITDPQCSYFTFEKLSSRCVFLIFNCLFNCLLRMQ